MAAGAAMPRARLREVLSGGLCIAGGVAVLLEARTYSIGTLGQLGPGFYPAILGALLALVGLAIAGTALAGMSAADEPEPAQAGGPDWRGWLCIVSGVILFVVCASLAGLAAAIFASVFAAALGDRTATLRGSLVLALVMTVAGTVLFGYLLRINMPIWQLPWAP